MKRMADKIRNITAKGRMDASSSWIVSYLQAADCRKAWHLPEWEDTVKRWHNLLDQVEEKDEEKTKEMEREKLVSRTIRNAEGAGFVAQDHKGITVERRSANFARRRGTFNTFLVRFEVRRNLGKPLAV